MICPKCGSSNIDLDYEFNPVYACLDCDYDWFHVPLVEQTGLPGLVSGVVVPQKTRKEKYNFPVYESVFSGDIGQLKLDDIEGLIEYRSSKRYQDKFVEYIKRTSQMFFNIIGADIDIQIPYKHRWEKSYRKGFLRKMYQLDIWAKGHHLTCGMISLTSAQTGFTDIEILERFKESWSKFADNLRIMGFLYFVLYEPHESGLPHMHAMIFGDCSPEKIIRLENLWHSHYEMGAKDFDFNFKAGLRENIDSIVNYLMKYLSKTIIIDVLNDPALVRFHSMFFETGGRMFSSSRYLSYVMRKIKITSIPIEAIFCDNREIYNRADSKSVPSKYQNIKGVRYKYELLPFEIKSKIERNLPFVPFGHNEQRYKENGQLKFMPLNNSLRNFASWINNMDFMTSCDVY
jgi:hypothetical protein